MKLRYYQKEASQSAAKYLSTSDRTTCIMCCGSGKTIVGVKVADLIKADIVLIECPTLILSEQVKSTWDQNQSKKVVIFNSENITSEEDLKTEILNNDKLVVVTTYNSATLCVDVFSKLNKKIDLAIYDEAHRTAGKFSSLFNNSLKRKEIKKHFLMTATPKLAKFKGNEDIQVFSMDDEEIYGENCYYYSLRDGINDGVVTDYRIVVSHVSENDLRKNIFSDEKTKYYAMALSLKKAIEKFNLNKIITFHSTIKDAKALAKVFSEVVNDFDVYHISSHQPPSERDENYNGYKNSTKAIITNARCFGEGIDVPETDGIMFCDERHSQIEIIQNVGRAVRNYENKKFGYIIVPALVDGISTGLGDYSYLLNVVSAISQEDSELQASVFLRLTEKNEFYKSFFKRIKIIGGSNLKINELEDKIYVEIMKSPKTFYERLEQLKRYVSENGNMDIPKDYGDGLWGWTNYIKEYRRKGLLPQSKIDILTKAGFDWTVYNPIEYFQERFDQLRLIHEQKSYKIKSGVISYFGLLNEDFLKFTYTLRTRYKRNELRPEYIEMLESIGFQFDPAKVRRDFYSNRIDYFLNKLIKQEDLSRDEKNEFIKLKHEIKHKKIDVTNESIEKIKKFEQKLNIDFFESELNSYTTEKKSEAIELRKSGLSMYKVAERLGVNTSTVKNWLRGVPVDEQVKQKQTQAREKLIKDVISLKKQGVPNKEITEKLNITIGMLKNIYQKNKKIKEIEK